MPSVERHLPSIKCTCMGRTCVRQTASGPPPRHHLRTSENMKKKKNPVVVMYPPFCPSFPPNTKREAKKITSVGEGGIESFGTPAHRPRCCHARAAQNKQKNVRRGSRPLFPRFQSKRVCRWGVYSWGGEAKRWQRCEGTRLAVRRQLIQHPLFPFPTIPRRPSSFLWECFRKRGSPQGGGGCC